LLLADEPTGNLDSAAGSEVVQLLLRLRKERGMTVIVATHDFSVASRCDRMVGLRDGSIVDDVRLAPDDPSSILKRVGGLDPRG
jgi:putative ABC transport system ATP-binding protein